MAASVSSQCIRISRQARLQRGTRCASCPAPVPVRSFEFYASAGSGDGDEDEDALLSYTSIDDGGWRIGYLVSVSGMMVRVPDYYIVLLIPVLNTNTSPRRVPARRCGRALLYRLD